MEKTHVNIDLLTIKEKAALVEKLTKIIIDEATSEEFQNVSDSNKRIAGVFRTFRSQYVGSASSMNKFLKDADS